MQAVGLLSSSMPLTKMLIPHNCHAEPGGRLLTTVAAPADLIDRQAEGSDRCPILQVFDVGVLACVPDERDLLKT